MKWFGNFRKGLLKTTVSISNGLKNVLSGQKIDKAFFEEMQDVLMAADIGFPVAKQLVEKLHHLKIGADDDLENAVKKVLSAAIAEMIKPYSASININYHGSKTIILCGVNGNGKTTTAGKLAKHFQDAGKRVVLAACDTFRASAVEQLVAWGERIQCEVVVGQDRQDPSSVAYSAQMKIQEGAADLLIVDTAGRLHSNQNLMLELAKIIKVINKLNKDAPHEVWMVLDGSNGQNTLQQLDAFMKVIKVNGLIVTKLDGSTKGGIILTLAQTYKLPIYAVGVGEEINDMVPLDPVLFADALMGLSH